MKFFRKLRLKTRMIIGGGVPIILIIALGILSRQSINALLDVGRKVEQTNTTISELNTINTMLSDLERTEKIFLITGDPKYSDVWVSLKTTFGTQLSDLKSSMTQAQIDQLVTLERLLNVWYQETDQEILARRKIDMTPQERQAMRLQSGEALSINVEDVVDPQLLRDVQKFYSGATGVANLVVEKDGTPVKFQTYDEFQEFCFGYQRKNPKGLELCKLSDAQGPQDAEKAGRDWYYCYSGGLIDFGFPIAVDGEQIGNWLGGQILLESPDEEKFRQQAANIGLEDPEGYLKALRNVPIVPEVKLNAAIELLKTISTTVSQMGNDLYLRKNLVVLIENGKSAAVLTEIRAILDAIRATELTVLTVWQQSAEQAANLTQDLILGGTIFAGLFACTISFVITRNLLAQLGGEPSEIEQIAWQVSEGNLSAASNKKQQKTVGILAAMHAMTVKIHAVLNETEGLSQNIRDGKLTARTDVDAFEGSWRELVVGLNHLIDAFVIPINTTAAYIEQVSKGDLPARIVAEYQGDFENMRQNLNRLIDATQEVTRVAAEIANGNLTLEVRERSHQDVLMQALNLMIARLTAVVLNVKIAAQDVALRSREMSVAAEQLSEGTSQQAAATEEVSASMEEMAANIRQTADNARLTEGIAVTSAEDARAGKQAVTEIIQAMELIADRISVVQEIAGQTNILSLNATIEAAKAQEFGKGFTVVASSVRDLARQTRAAADEIRSLVHACVALSAEAGDILQRLVPNSEKTAELVQEINVSSQEQSTGVEHVNQAVQQLDGVTQHTAATAEQVAATAESLTTQADALQKTMAFFTVNEAQLVVQPQEEEVVHLLQGIAKERLVALLTSALSGQPQNAKAATADLIARPLKPSAARDRASAPGNSNDAGDERDQEFERY